MNVLLMVPAFGMLLVERFGVAVLDLLDNDPDKLLGHGISRKKLAGMLVALPIPSAPSTMALSLRKRRNLEQCTHGWILQLSWVSLLQALGRC